MVDALVTSAIEALLGLEVAATSRTDTNRFSVEGLTFSRDHDGALLVEIRKCEAASLRISFGSLLLELGRLALNQVTAQVRIEEGRPRLVLLEVADVELSGVKVHGPLTDARRDSHASHLHRRRASGNTSAGEAAAGAWRLDPLSAAEGTIRAEIVDAVLMFDADVTVPIRGGQIDFNETTVAHVGPNSSMGVSRLGLYVDAPNGRSYVYQFSSAPVAGVEFEQRGGLLGSRVTDRGKLRLQTFGEGVLLQGAAGPGAGITEQTRSLFDRTAVSGNVQLSDGRFATPHLQADLVGRATDCNALRVTSEAVGRGFSVAMPGLCVRQVGADASGTRVTCDEITGGLVLRLDTEGAQLAFTLDVSNMKASGVRLQPRSAETV